MVMGIRGLVGSDDDAHACDGIAVPEYSGGTFAYCQCPEDLGSNSWWLRSTNCTVGVRTILTQGA